MITLTLRLLLHRHRTLMNYRLIQIQILPLRRRRIATIHRLPPPSPPPPSPTSSSAQSPPPQKNNVDQSLVSSSSPPPPETSKLVSPPPPSTSKSSPPSPPPSPPPSNSGPPPPSVSPPPPKVESSPPPPILPPPSTSTSGSSSPPPPQSSGSPPSNDNKPPPPLSEQIPPPSPYPATSTAKAPPPSVLSSASGASQIPPPPFSPPATPVSTGTPPEKLSPTASDQPNVLTPPTRSGSSPRPSSSNNQSSSSPSNPTSSNSKTDSSSGKGGSSTNTGTIVGATVAGIVIVALIAVVFALSRSKKKKRSDKVYSQAPYMPPGNFTVKSDGYYSGQHFSGQQFSGEQFSGQQYSYAHSSPPESSYYGNSQVLPQHSMNYGSQRGNAYHHGGGPESGVISGGCSLFTYEELMEITRGFERQNVIGEGGFGSVYKGWLPDGRPVAVKQLKAGSGQGEREFRAEVEIISRVHHRHLVSLVGYCICEKQRLLIYEFLPNNTLEHHLHGDGQPVLEWTKRMKIALGSAKGLAYLHEDCHPRIIHRDIKSSNILLDNAFEAQVSDFGLAKLSNDTNTHVSTRVMGTFGYLAPEYASSGKLTDRSDVFSFGVVLLELITGRKPVDPTQPFGDESLVEWARPFLLHALETGDLSKIVDPRLGKQYVESEMFRMIEAAAGCVRHSAPKRPRMAQVARALDCEGEASDLSNGVKYGQSTAYDSGQYNEDIIKFRRMALGSSDSSGFDMYSSGEFNSREVSGPQDEWRSQDGSSSELETRAFTTKRTGDQQRIGGSQSRSNFGSYRL
ncbi:hypothetical protein FNV43_RR26001 [Rhamnella rubrinervis]|uniref:non-specific serine/threonine protein kinase n=1 Tax=Rhamnella rubrinervis TaxID=2594499 RepID=A0A8K0DIW1_9ROSA|nr:hypothetical protein FNV43_RR26001 [Rhamnella rubrinervis]